MLNLVTLNALLLLTMVGQTITFLNFQKFQSIRNAYQFTILISGNLNHIRKNSTMVNVTLDTQNFFNIWLPFF